MLPNRKRLYSYWNLWNSPWRVFLGYSYDLANFHPDILIKGILIKKKACTNFFWKFTHRYHLFWYFTTLGSKSFFYIFCYTTTVVNIIMSEILLPTPPPWTNIKHLLKLWSVFIQKNHKKLEKLHTQKRTNLCEK